jgi:CBS domain-containing protein
MLLARNIMQHPVVTIAVSDTLHHAISVMQEEGVSGLPVVDSHGDVVGMLTEGDLLRRAELDTEKVRSSWLDFFMSSGAMAQEYTHAHSQMVADVMTSGAIVAESGMPLEGVVSLMQARHVKRIPVVDGKALVGIISRHDMLAALAKTFDSMTVSRQTDDMIGAAIQKQLDALKWGWIESVKVGVIGGVATLRGMITDGRERPALHALVSNTPGVTRIIDEMAWVDLTSGTVLDEPSLPGLPVPRQMP